MRAASWTTTRLRSLHPEWPVVIATEGGQPWSKARAVNQAANVGSADTLLVMDADVALPAGALKWAVAAVEGFGAAWSVPYSTVFRLTAEHTARVLASRQDIELEPVNPMDCLRHRPPYAGVPGGGVFAVARDAWSTSGGFDPRFEWGQEDVSLAAALDTLAGPCVQLDGPLLHLWHPERRPSRSMYDAHALEAQYLAARGKPEAMRRLIRQRSVAVPHTAHTPV